MIHEDGNSGGSRATNNGDVSDRIRSTDYADGTRVTNNGDGTDRIRSINHADGNGNGIGETKYGN